MAMTIMAISGMMETTMSNTDKMEDYTKYEQARIIGARALQISMGAPFLIKLDDEGLKKLGYNPVEIAKLEFRQGLIPIMVKRPMPGATKRDAAAKPFDQTKLE